jgi:capsule polysaccharide export protein KpsC/LpsZ
MFWDASFFYGKDLFRDYQEWFIETIRAAVANPCLNWLVKIHPANTVKNRREGITGELAENAVIRQHIGILPAHVKIIPADSNINTFSLFSLMDYCLTVRGTIGIEAASCGIPVITAGTGRYDRHGFTIDSDSRGEYLDKLSHLHQIPPLKDGQHELAQRFAYASFLMRPFLTQSFRFNFQHDAKATIQAAIVARSLADLLDGDDIRAFAAWGSMPEQLDFICNYGPNQP